MPNRLFVSQGTARSCQHAAWKPSNLSDKYQQQSKVYTWPTKDAATLKAGLAVMTAVTSPLSAPPPLQF
jgi:hypothetical protein